MFEPSPVAVQVKAHRDNRWVTARTVDQCYGWFDRGQSGHHFALQPLRGDQQTLLFVARTPKRNGVEKFNFRLRGAQVTPGEEIALGRVVHRGVFSVRTTFRPARRVYAWRGTKVNDEYWNFCVNKGKEVRLHNGIAYCVRPSVTRRRVRATTA